MVHEDDDSFLNPQSPYAETKIKIEKRLSTYKNGYMILRLGTIFGVSSGMRFHTAINKFCFEAATGSPLTVWRENYDQRRPYLGLNDAVNAIRFLVQNEAWNETYNILTGNYRLSDIISWIKDAADITINMVDTPLLNQFSYEVSDEKIKSIGFKPTDDLFNEINKTLHKLRNLSKHETAE
ncbi:MAG: SDR family oxidoreductase [Proteobacteria bacterium]|nr:SDR family oxidoreductase [Pseudomonadota bacterium]